jgi:hypothetical protein
MRIHLVGAELCHVRAQTQRQTDRWMGRQTDRQDEADTRFSQFYERA